MSNTETEEVPQSPLCRELRSKKFFYLEALPLSASDIRDASGHCWCRRTMQVVGPDGNRVRPEGCTPGRDCYELHFA